MLVHEAALVQDEGLIRWVPPTAEEQHDQMVEAISIVIISIIITITVIIRDLSQSQCYDFDLICVCHGNKPGDHEANGPLMLISLYPLVKDAFKLLIITKIFELGNTFCLFNLEFVLILW